MSFTIWTPLAVSSEARLWAADAWRMVEAQHIASTMKIVDNAAEQDLLESLLEGSKPAQPSQAAGLDYLLATPFRYDPKRGGSRFRGETDPGVFYGAQSVRTACAELGYWRWKFLKDAVDLVRLEPVAHTAFRAAIATSAVDLRTRPFEADVSALVDPNSYGVAQRFARVARQAEVGAIVYQSVRDSDTSWCVAVLTPQAFVSRKPDALMQTWWIAVHQDEVIWRRDSESWIFDVQGWAA